MSWLSRIEETCAAFIERAFAKTFPSDLEPAQIARKLVATMEARTMQDGERGMAAPNRYDVVVHEEDFERLAPHRGYLEREWATLLSDVAQRVGITFLGGKPVVSLHAGSGIVAGAMEIEASSDETIAITHARRTYVLRMIKGVPADRSFTLRGTMSVGRNEDREIFLVDPSVSRTHAMIETEGGFPVVHDLASKNGTFVNGDRVTTKALSAGDTVAFGNTVMRVELASE
jgi:hypothetical protein